VTQTGWQVIIPVKRTVQGKSRLASFAGALRSDLAYAIALDTISAAIAAPGVARLFVVTDDERVHEEAARLGAHVLADAGGGLNAALRHGADAAAALEPDASTCRAARRSAGVAGCRPDRGARPGRAVTTGHSSPMPRRPARRCSPRLRDRRSIRRSASDRVGRIVNGASSNSTRMTPRRSAAATVGAACAATSIPTHRFVRLPRSAWASAPGWCSSG